MWWILVDFGPKRCLEGHGAPKKPPGRALGTSKGATEQKSAVFGCLFGAILEPKLGPKPPRAVFRIVKITLVFIAFLALGGPGGGLGGV